MHITDLGGHSGCAVLLCESESNKVFVRKISKHIDYNDRLKIQAKKQTDFANNSIKTPIVLNQGETDKGLFFFDMEYISGITLAEYIKTIEIGKIRNLVQTIVCEVINPHFIGKHANTQDVFQNKISELREIINPVNGTVVDKALYMLEKHSWDKFILSGCHGDLTLENIIIKDNQIYLIDFLDSFYDCWILDIGTLLQDVQTLWSYRLEDEININTLIRLIVFRDILVDAVNEIAPGYYFEMYYALLLKLVRIFPYTNDTKTYDFLNEKTQSVISIIEQEREK